MAKKIVKICPRSATFSLQPLKSDRLLAARQQDEGGALFHYTAQMVFMTRKTMQREFDEYS
jgi:hypothetical protein